MNNQDYEKMYLDWYNNYLTIEKFARAYGLSLPKALEIIQKGRKINHATK